MSEWSKEAIMMDMVSDIRCDIHGDIYGHEALAERIADHIAALKKENEELLQDAKRIYWAGAKDMRELLAEKMIAFGKSVHTEALPEFPAGVIRVEIREVNDE